MKQLWAPWRMKFILSHKEKGCVFCREYRERKDVKNHVIHRGKTVFIVLNLYPYSNGHLLIVPNRHIDSLDKLADVEQSELMQLTVWSTKLLKKVFNPDGFNIGLNIGAIAGAGIAGHIHVHVVPRWRADTNFMPIISETKIIAELVDETYKKLKRVVTKVL